MAESYNSAYQFSPEALAQIEAAKTGGIAMPSMLYSQPGTLSPMDPLYEYAKTAPVLALTGNKEHESLNFQPRPDGSYRLVVGGKVIGTASSPEEAALLVAEANRLSEAGGAKADVKIEEQLPYTLAGETAPTWKPIYENDPNGTGLLGTLIPAALAAMSGGALAPFLGGALGVGSTVATGLAAGLGSTAGSLFTGSSLGDALKKGAITGITAGGLSGLGAFGDVGGSSLTDQISSTLAENVAQMGGQGLGSALGGSIGSGLGAGVSGLADEAIINVLGNTLGSGAGAGLGSAVGGALGSIAGSGGSYQPQPGDSPMINVTAPTVSTGSLSGMAGLSGIGAQAVRDILAQQALAAQQTQGDEITVTAPAVGGGALLPALGLGGLGLAGLGAVAGSGGSAAAPIAETIDPEMVVTASPDGGLIIPPAVPSAGLNPGSLLPAAVPLVVPPTTLPATNPRTIGDYINAVRGGVGVIGGIGSLLGGDGDQGSGLPAGFNPNSGTVTYTPLNRTQNAAPFDPFTYGQTSGERSFFNPYELQYQTNVPSAPAPAMKDGGEAEFDDSIEGHLAAYYSNGGHAGPGPVKGIGSGQEDKIPAWLSDGEYVWSAQDVADLGDGSSDEGVRRLDKMRQMVRKGAGRKDTKSIARPQKGIDTMLKAVGGAA